MSLKHFLENYDLWIYETYAMVFTFFKFYYYEYIIIHFQVRFFYNHGAYGILNIFKYTIKKLINLAIFVKISKPS